MLAASCLGLVGAGRGLIELLCMYQALGLIDCF